VNPFRSPILLSSTHCSQPFPVYSTAAFNGETIPRACWSSEIEGVAPSTSPFKVTDLAHQRMNLSPCLRARPRESSTLFCTRVPSRPEPRHDYLRSG
jgi:hypothetical protein